VYLEGLKRKKKKEEETQRKLEIKDLRYLKYV
jgi:hypothetical protein